MTMLYPNPCYNEVCYKGKSIVCQLLISSLSNGAISLLIWLDCVGEKSLWILISWLHQKPADLGLHCLSKMV